ncbi:DNA-N1-methyladenine dioxygenase [Candidatus Koribacter versatilis Ellin345]|uniref:DNA-N1-methyladenine dioxygenase n=1 Tax=Koribacter versatilis (strain Ellin345) TaxID=204669 RepID=Q1ISZ1_KORVE|nr:DNA oxidative demethylase AlkB [Candidatus Koribacter versatilis]ABF40009.1 DNA-N1-methyladenine dioxygenase [Candidatus Koribacter versatilis Ellin345]
MTHSDLPLWPETRVEIREGAVLLRGFALSVADELLPGIREVASVAEFRNMVTPGGHVMSVAMTNCGRLGWVTDSKGYRYTTEDPSTGKRWPEIPEAFEKLAREAADAAGFSGFAPDACLINRYAVGARMTLHQDRNEQDFGQPIVSVSLGLPATFQFGEVENRRGAQNVAVRHGDVVVWGGTARLAYHGVLALKAGVHEATGEYRFNLTFRRAG